jgi:hypothetical protein
MGKLQALSRLKESAGRTQWTTIKAMVTPKLIGPHGEIIIINTNGKQLRAFCMYNNLVMTDADMTCHQSRRINYSLNLFSVYFHYIYPEVPKIRGRKGMGKGRKAKERKVRKGIMGSRERGEAPPAGGVSERSEQGQSPQFLFLYY